MEEIETKIEFARRVAGGEQPFNILSEWYPTNNSFALYAADEWVKDEFVKKQIEFWQNHTPTAKGIDKEQFLKIIFEKMQGEKLQNGRVAKPEDEDFVKMARLYAEVAGFIDKPQAAQQNLNIQINKVMEVYNHGTDDQWEAGIEEQQRKLLDESRTKH